MNWFLEEPSVGNEKHEESAPKTIIIFKNNELNLFETLDDVIMNVV